MSKLEDSMVTAGRQAGGSYETLKARESHLKQVAQWMRHEGNLQLRDVSKLRAGHVIAYVNAHKDRLGKGTLQNRLSALRQAMRHAGKDAARAADSERMSNPSLGIDGRSRIGTKTAISPERYALAYSTLQERGMQREAAALQVAASLGLRGEEAVQAGKSLSTWERRLAEGKDTVRVIHGTKGGRPRDVRVPPERRAATLAAVREARTACGGSQKLVVGHKGDLKTAKTRWRYATQQVAGLTGQESPHSLRYAFAQNQMGHYAADGYTEGESRAQASCDLGHGDGRGRFVASTYSR